MMNMLSSMSQEDYDISGNNILYGKLFPKLVEDFLTRKDAEKMMASSNLSVSTDVQVIPGIGVQVAPANGTGATSTPGKGRGTGQVTASYKGTHPDRSVGTHTLEAKRKKEKLTGQTQTESSTTAISAAAGGEIG